MVRWQRGRRGREFSGPSILRKPIAGLPWNVFGERRLVLFKPRVLSGLWLSGKRIHPDARTTLTLRFVATTKHPAQRETSSCSNRSRTRRTRLALVRRSKPNEQNTAMRSWNKSSKVREIQILSDQEPIVELRRVPNLAVAPAARVLVSNGMNIVVETRQNNRQTHRKVLVEFDFHRECRIRNAAWRAPANLLPRRPPQTQSQPARARRSKRENRQGFPRRSLPQPGSPRPCEQ